MHRGLFRGHTVSGGRRRVKVKPTTMKQKVRNIEAAAGHAVAALYDGAPGAAVLPEEYKYIDRGRKSAYLDLPGLSAKSIRDEKGRRFAVDPIPGFNSLVDDALKLSWEHFAVDEELLARRGGLIRTFERKQSGSCVCWVWGRLPCWSGDGGGSEVQEVVLYESKLNTLATKLDSQAQPGPHRVGPALRVLSQRTADHHVRKRPTDQAVGSRGREAGARAHGAHRRGFVRVLFLR